METLVCSSDTNTERLIKVSEIIPVSYLRSGRKTIPHDLSNSFKAPVTISKEEPAAISFPISWTQRTVVNIGNISPIIAEDPRLGLFGIANTGLGEEFTELGICDFILHRSKSENLSDFFIELDKPSGGQGLNITNQITRLTKRRDYEVYLLYNGLRIVEEDGSIHFCRFRMDRFLPGQTRFDIYKNGITQEDLLNVTMWMVDNSTDYFRKCYWNSFDWIENADGDIAFTFQKDINTKLLQNLDLIPNTIDSDIGILIEPKLESIKKAFLNGKLDGESSRTFVHRLFCLFKAKIKLTYLMREVHRI